MTKKETKYYFNKLKYHVGHSIEIVGYEYSIDKTSLYPSDEDKEWENISIECLDCNEVLIDFENNEK